MSALECRNSLYRYGHNITVHVGFSDFEQAGPRTGGGNMLFFGSIFFRVWVGVASELDPFSLSRDRRVWVVGILGPII